jgi:hypothetical protein
MFGIQNAREMSISKMLQRDTNDSRIVGVHGDLILGSVTNRTLIVEEAVHANTIYSSTTGLRIDRRDYWEGCVR